jgi:hypothetical protein
MIIFPTLASSHSHAVAVSKLHEPQLASAGLISGLISGAYALTRGKPVHIYLAGTGANTFIISGIFLATRKSFIGSEPSQEDDQQDLVLASRRRTPMESSTLAGCITAGIVGGIQSMSKPDDRRLTRTPRNHDPSLLQIYASGF